MMIPDLAVTHDFGWNAQYEIPCPICEDIYFAIGEPRFTNVLGVGPHMQIPVSSDCKHGAWLLNIVSRHPETRTYFEIPVVRAQRWFSLVGRNELTNVQAARSE